MGNKSPTVIQSILNDAAPCKFCGSTELNQSVINTENGEVDAIECKECFASASVAYWGTKPSNSHNTDETFSLNNLPPCSFCGSKNLSLNSWHLNGGDVDAVECNACLSGAPLDIWFSKFNADLRLNSYREFMKAKLGDETYTYHPYQGDGEDNLDSLVNSVCVVIRADDLRHLIGEGAAELKKIADAIHYPDCWCTTAYPSMFDAVIEFIKCNPEDCSRQQ